MAHLLIVDDEPSIRELLEISFRKEGHKVEVAASGEAAKRHVASQMFDIVVSDICMPDMDGVELLRYCKEVSPSTVFILITGVPTIGTAIDAVNFGADRYVIKGDRLLDELRPAVQHVAESLALRKEAGYLRRELRRLTGLDHMIGTSPKMRSIFELIQNIAPQSSRVLITGESERERSSSHAPSTRIAPAPKARSSPSIAAPSPKPCWNRSCSAMSRARSPARTTTGAGFSMPLILARFLWTRSAI